MGWQPGQFPASAVRIPANLLPGVGILPLANGGTGSATPFGSTANTFAQGNDTRFVFDGSGNLPWNAIALGQLGHTSSARGNSQIYNSSALRVVNSSLDLVNNYPRGAGNLSAALTVAMTPGSTNSAPIAQQCGGWLSGTTPSSFLGCPNGIDSTAIIAQYTSGTDAALGHYTGTFTSTTFAPTSPISASISALVVVGTAIASNDNPPYLGQISALTKDGSGQITSVTVDAFCTTSACGTPSGTTAYFAPGSNGWAVVGNCILSAGTFTLPGRFAQALCFEAGPKNDTGSYTAGANGNILLDRPFTAGYWVGVSGSQSSSASFAGAASNTQYQFWGSSASDSVYGAIATSGGVLKNYNGSLNTVNIAFDGTTQMFGNGFFGYGIGNPDASVKIGGARTADGNAYYDFQAASASTVDARIIRASGANGALQINNSGTGGISLRNCTSGNAGSGCVNAASWDSSGNATFAANIIDTHFPTSCTSQPSGTVWNNSGVLNVCP